MDTIYAFIQGLFTFRSEEHFSWFVTTMAILAGVALASAAVRKWGGPKLRDYAEGQVWSLGVGFLFVSGMAVINQIWRFMPEEVMSTDCIWYNFLLFMVLYGLSKWVKPSVETAVEQGRDRF